MSTFKGSVSVTYIGTATALLQIDNVTFLTDPFFSPSGAEWDLQVVLLKVSQDPAIKPADLPPIDAVLLSHEDHPDNLDEIGRQVLEGKKVFTTKDGAKNIGNKAIVTGMNAGDKTTLVANGKTFEIIATPAEHAPQGECIGFIVTSPDFGTTNGLPNAIFFSGDTIYNQDVANSLKGYHISLALLNLGRAAVEVGAPEPLAITMDGKQAAQLIKDADVEKVVPMHFEGWGHFSEGREEATKAFAEAGVSDKVLWLPRGERKGLF
ncbi:Metallo-hydrolase/oxidoreductase [Trichoderma citrinoviride]|uniref:Metallo-hydrolase/oxidoreductase n=1 Tax=Trichoderma citrinoviride TaxID=58853 RepID=A0A2T4BH12_9HYPO|nr:Metallo-hydrolase/oxidoreductase [Trichoderma citrinoviride]PTB68602.1 Metallo-hydrolase/oxidoreductase [Trichoderma citrinoviride]